MKKNRNQLEFEIHLRSDRFIEKFCPYSKEDIQKAIELCINYDKDEEWLFKAVEKHPDKDLIELTKFELLQ